MILTVQLPPVYPYQERAIFGAARCAVIEGATKCGKTYPCLLWLLSRALEAERGNRAHWWVAPIYQQARIAYRRLKTDMLAQADPSGSLWTAHDSELRITIAGRGDIWFKSADNPEGLYGDDVYAVVIDEATRCGDDSWAAVRSTLTATRGPMRVIGNVRGRKNWAYRLARRAESGEPGLSHAKITADDAIAVGLLSRDEVDAAARDLPHALFRELYYCEPSEDAGNPFGMQHIEACTLDGLAPGPAAAWGVDLARKVDYTVVVGVNADGAVCALDRWHGTSWADTESRVAALVRDTPAYADESGVGDPIVERLTRLCPALDGYPTGPRHVQLIQGLIADVQQRRVRFPAGVIRTEMEAYEYRMTRTGRAGYGAPEGMHDDCVVALALAAARLDAHRTLGEVSIGWSLRPRAGGVWPDD